MCMFVSKNKLTPTNCSLSSAPPVFFLFAPSSYHYRPLMMIA